MIPRYAGPQPDPTPEGPSGCVMLLILAALFAGTVVGSQLMHLTGMW